MADQRNPLQQDLSRRFFGILGIGTVGTAALAACQADTGGSSEGENGGAQAESGANNPEGVFHVGQPFEAPPTGHFNVAPGVTQALSMGVYGDLMLPSGGMWDWAAEEWLFLIAEDFELTEDQFIYHVTPGLTWSDGSDLTAEDVEMTFWVNWLMNQPAWSSGLAGLQSDGDLQVTFDLDNPSVNLERQVLKTRILPAALYGQFGEQARDLFESGDDTDSGAANDLREELQEWRPENEDLVTSGPFIWDLDSISDATMTLIKNENGVLADQVAFQSIVIHDGETEDISPLVLDGTIDYATHNFPISTVEQWEAAGVDTKTPGIYNGSGITFAMGAREEFNDPRFRQAIALSFDKEEAAIVAQDEFGAVSEFMSGMAGLLEEQWLDEDTKAELDSYEFDQDRAASLLEDAGWSRDNGRWLTPDDEPATFTITFEADHTNRPAFAQYLAEVLGEFGITLELDGIEGANFTERLHTGQFELMVGNWGAGELHPQYSYSNAFIDENEPVSRNHGGRGMDYDLVREIEGMGEVDIQQLVRQSGVGLDEDEQRDIVNQLALIFNRELPKIPVWERFGNNPAQEGPRVLEFPADDDPIWSSAAYSDNPVIQTMYRGLLLPS